jgi:hypothetical protein
MASDSHRDLRQAIEVLGVRRHDHVDDLGAPHDAPGAECEPADHHEPDLCLRQASEDLVEGGRAHRRAAFATCIRAWLKAMVSAKLTLIGRRASSRSRRSRIASAAAAGPSWLRAATDHMVGQHSATRTQLPFLGKTGNNFSICQEHFLASLGNSFSIHVPRESSVRPIGDHVDDDRRR